MSLTKNVALRMPPIRRLYDERNALKQSNDLLLNTVALLRNEKSMVPSGAGKNHNSALGKLTNPVPLGATAYNLAMTYPDSPDIAFLCSHERTGNWWIGRVLNRHPETVCGVGPLVRPYIERGDTPDTVVPPDSANDLESLRRFAALSLDELLEVFKADQPGYRFYVRTHSINAYELYKKMGLETSKYRISVANVIRHPIARAHSYRAEWQHDPGTQLHLRMQEVWDIDPRFRRYTDKILSKFPDVDFTNRTNRYFVMAVLWIAKDLNDFALPIRHFRYEDLVGHPESLVPLFKHLLGRDFHITPEFMAAAGAEGPANGHSKKRRTAVEVYTGWEPWQKYCFRLFMEEYPVEATFQQFGYDFSFVD